MTKEQLERQRRIEAVLDRLVVIGWVSRVVAHDSKGVVVEWTDKGRERAKWMKEIASELHGSEADLMALAVICRVHSHP